MDGLAMPTGSLPAVREALGLMTYPPQTASVRQARRFVEQVVAASDVAGLADDAGLLVCELAANAVLHARTDFDVAVYRTAGGVRVSVRDRSAALPMLVAPSATAMSGRGLALVQALAWRWGAGPSASAPKSVWFELAVDAGGAGELAGSAAGGPPVELSVEELLAAWSDEDDAATATATATAAEPEMGAPTVSGEALAPVVSVSDPARAPGQVVTGRVVELPALDAADLLGAKEAMEDALRELQLLLLGTQDRVAGHAAGQARGEVQQKASGAAMDRVPAGADSDAAVLGVASKLDQAARDFAGIRAAVRQQVSRAVAAGQVMVVLRLEVGEDTARHALAYAEAVRAAEALAASGRLLGVPGALVRHRAVRRAYLHEVIAAASQ